MGNIFNKHKTLSVGLVIVVTPLVAKLFGWCLGKCKIALLPPAKIESVERNEVIFFPELAITGKNPAGLMNCQKNKTCAKINRPITGDSDDNLLSQATIGATFQNFCLL